VEKSLTVIAYIFAKAGEEERLKRALLDLVAQTRKEKGCINYDLHQSQDNACEFVMYENWESAVDLDAHANSTHLLEFGKSMGQFQERPTQVTKWNMASEPGNS
jgi:quinol monooxygenase YgiN